MQANPFTPGAGAPPPALVGRDLLTADFLESLERTGRAGPHQGTFLVGLRGVGKTVLLNAWVAAAKQRGFRSIMLEATDTGQFLASLAQATRQELLRMRPSQVVGDRVRHALSVLKSFSLTIGAEGPRFGIDIDPAAGYADTGDPELDLRDLFKAVGEAANERQQPVLVAIDELQYLQRTELAAFIAAFHHSVQLGLPLLVVGSGLPNLRGLAGQAKTYAERLFRFPELGPLNAEDATHAIQEPALRSNARFSEEAVSAIFNATHGYPYFLQEWAHDAWGIAERSPITRTDVDAATLTVARRLDENFFRVRFDRLTDRERYYLRAMSELGPGPHRSGEVAGVYGAPVTSLAPLREVLISKGMIYSPAHGETAFSVPLFDDFMRRAIPNFEETRRSMQTARQRSRSR